MADPSFDVVSKIERQEVDNALNQAAKELSQRFDFRGVNASIDWSGELGIVIKADTEERAKAALDVFKEKLVKRSISLKALDAGEAKASGKQFVITGTLQQGIPTGVAYPLFFWRHRDEVERFAAFRADTATGESTDQLFFGNRKKDHFAYRRVCSL